MKYCSKCGAELADDDSVCYKCGTSTNHRVDGAVRNEESGMKIAIKVFLIIGCVSSAAFYLIPLAWTIPMTVHYFNSLKDNKPVGTGFKVCTLLFVSMIAGILMLCDKD